MKRRSFLKWFSVSVAAPLTGVGFVRGIPAKEEVLPTPDPLVFAENTVSLTCFQTKEYGQLKRLTNAARIKFNPAKNGEMRNAEPVSLDVESVGRVDCAELTSELGTVKLSVGCTGAEDIQVNTCCLVPGDTITFNSLSMVTG